ncbi:MAG: hypothetical protein ACRCXN_02365 [Bacteroidales bacterium]
MAATQFPQTYLKEGKDDNFEYIFEVKCPFCGTELIKYSLPNDNFDFESETPLLIEKSCPHLVYMCDYETGFHIYSSPEMKKILIEEWCKLNPTLQDMIQQKYDTSHNLSDIHLEDFLMKRPQNARILAEKIAETYNSSTICYLDHHKKINGAGCCPTSLSFAVITMNKL